MGSSPVYNPGYQNIGSRLDLTDPNVHRTVGWNDYVAARQRAIEAYLRGDYTRGVPPDISRALSSRDSTGTFSNVRTDMPNITPEMQPLVDKLVSRYTGALAEGNRTGSYLPAGYRANTAENIARAGAIDQARIAESVPGYKSGGPGDPLAAQTRAAQLDAQAAEAGLNDQAKQATLAGYNQVYEPFLRTNTSRESGTQSSHDTQNAPRSAAEILQFLTPNAPNAVYQGPTSNAWGNAGQLTQAAFNLFGSQPWGQGQNRPRQTGATAPTPTPTDPGEESGWGAWGSW